MEELLADDAKVFEEVKKETKELRKKFGEPRRTEISLDAHDISREELEAHEQIVVTLSKGGYIKRIPADTYRNQHRGGRGVVSMNTKDDDPIAQILVVDTHDTLLFFTNRGRVLKLTAYELRADTSRNTRGVPLVNVIQLGDNEEVSALIGLKNLDQEDTYFIMGTEKGNVKRMAVSQMSNIRLSGLIAMNVKSDDQLIGVRLAKTEDDIIMVSSQGMSIRFPVSNVTPRQRAAGGMKGMVLSAKDRLVGMDIIKPDGDSRLLVISRLGYGKLTPTSEYRRQGRGGKGIKTFNIRSKTGPVAAAEIVDDSKEVYVVSEQAQVLRTSLSEISSMGRATQGVTIFKPQKGDAVSSIACVSDLDVGSSDDKSKGPSANGTSVNGHVTEDLDK